MLVVFLPFYAVDTKMLHGYNFVAHLTPPVRHIYVYYSESTSC